MARVKIGIITGSGTHSLAGMEASSALSSATPFGPAELTLGSWAGVEVVHVSRHGDGHVRLSNHVNHRANVAALREHGVDAVIGVTICGAVDPTLALGAMVVFDDLHFLANRLPDGSICSLHDEPGRPGRGHWVYDGPFSPVLRDALLRAARAAHLEARDGACYGHVDGPRFNTRSEIRMLAGCGVSAVSQTAGPETVLCGEAGLPYGLLGYVTDYANGVMPDPTPVEELTRLMGESSAAFTTTLEGALSSLAHVHIPATGTHISWQ